MTRFSLVLALCAAVACGDDDGGGADGSVDGARPDGGGVDSAMDEECDEPGRSETVACGACGEQIRFCTASEIWEYGPCGDEMGVCTPGETEMMACGNCGQSLSRCNASCEWEADGSCMDEGMCEPGERRRTSMGCDAGETREVLCTDTCGFEETEPCREDSCDDPGALETIECGRCGSLERFCAASGTWEYGVCEDEGMCDPGTMETVECGNCGTQTARCNTACEWVPSGSCSGEGECAPGATRVSTAGCDAGEARTETCGASCEYEAGMCGPLPAADIMLLFDTTGSHGNDISASVSALDTFVRDIRSRLTDANIGVASYADFPEGGFGGSGDEPFVGERAPTASAANVRTTLEGLTGTGGGDGPESGVEALGILADLPAHPLADPFSCGGSREGGGCWRPASQRFVVVFTDATNHNGPAAGGGLESPYSGISPDPLEWPEVRDAIIDSGIRLLVVVEEPAEAQHRRMLIALDEDPSEMLFLRSGSTISSSVLDDVVDRLAALAR
ncbi:MAG: hypothetical protein AAGE52_30815 [Myxococcota bacterium]